MLRRHPQVADAAVVALPADDGETELAAAFAGRAVDPAALDAWLRDQMPLHMVPARIRLLGGAPLNDNGKTDRNALGVDATGSDAKLVWTDPATIEAAGVAPWSDLPIWRPPGSELHDALHRGDVSRALAAGLRCRPAAETVADTWAWLRPSALAAEVAQAVGVVAARRCEAGVTRTFAPPGGECGLGPQRGDRFAERSDVRSDRAPSNLHHRTGIAAAAVLVPALAAGHPSSGPAVRAAYGA